ncbi:hypothetical protein PENTCL1PPCAC_1448, partial [Pristionchus entomophagus]
RREVSSIPLQRMQLLECGGCRETFDSLEARQRHRQEEAHVRHEYVGLVRCSFCEAEADNVYSCYDHLVEVHCDEWTRIIEAYLLAADFDEEFLDQESRLLLAPEAFILPWQNRQDTEAAINLIRRRINTILGIAQEDEPVIVEERAESPDPGTLIIDETEQATPDDVVQLIVPSGTLSSTSEVITINDDSESEGDINSFNASSHSSSSTSLATPAALKSPILAMHFEMWKPILEGLPADSTKSKAKEIGLINAVGETGNIHHVDAQLVASRKRVSTEAASINPLSIDSSEERETLQKRPRDLEMPPVHPIPAASLLTPPCTFGRGTDAVNTVEMGVYDPEADLANQNLLLTPDSTVAAHSQLGDDPKEEPVLYMEDSTSDIVEFLDDSTDYKDCGDPTYAELMDADTKDGLLEQIKRMMPVVPPPAPFSMAALLMSPESTTRPTQLQQILSNSVYAVQLQPQAHTTHQTAQQLHQVSGHQPLLQRREQPVVITHPQPMSVISRVPAAQMQRMQQSQPFLAPAAVPSPLCHPQQHLQPMPYYSPVRVVGVPAVATRTPQPVVQPMRQMRLSPALQQLNPLQPGQQVQQLLLPQRLESHSSNIQEDRRDKHKAFWRSNGPTTCPICGKTGGASNQTKRNHYLKFHFAAYFERVTLIGVSDGDVDKLTRFLGTNLGATNQGKRMCLHCDSRPSGRAEFLKHLKENHYEKFLAFLGTFVPLQQVCPIVVDEDVIRILCDLAVPPTQ